MSGEVEFGADEVDGQFVPTITIRAFGKDIKFTADGAFDDEATCKEFSIELYKLLTAQSTKHYNIQTYENGERPLND